GRLVIGGLIRITRSCGVFLVCGRLVGRGLRGRSSFGPASLDPVGEQAHRGGDGETDRDPGEQCLAGDQRRDQRAQRRQDQDQDEKQHDELHHETVGGYRDGGGVARTPSPSLKPYDRGRYPRGYPASARGPKLYPCPPWPGSLWPAADAGAAEPLSSSSRSCDSRNPRSLVRYSRSIVRSSSIFLLSTSFSALRLFIDSVYLRCASRSSAVALSRDWRSIVSALVRASLSIVSALPRASLTIASAFDRASDSSCSAFVRASASMPSDSAFASPVSRSAISCARPSTLAACTFGSLPSAIRPAAVACVCSAGDGAGTAVSRRSSRPGGAAWAAAAASLRAASSSASSCSTCCRSSLFSSIRRASSVS